MTELEACVLAVIWRDGPCTGYQVRMQFERSLASSWRASTGSVYPLIKRMTLNGLVKRTSVTSDQRGTRLLRTTAEGRKAVRNWLKELPDWLGDAAEDPIRTRVHFIALLPAKDRPRIIGQMIVITRTSLTKINKCITDLEQSNQKIEWLVHRGAKAMIEARLVWLRDLQKVFPGNQQKSSQLAAAGAP